MEQAAADDAERERNRARLYAPPPGMARRRTADAPAGGRPGVSRAQASALIDQLAAEDARLNQPGAR